MAVLRLTSNGDIHVGTSDAAGDGLAGTHLHAGEELVHGREKAALPRRGQQFIQRGHQHVPRNAHIALQI